MREKAGTLAESRQNLEKIGSSTRGELALVICEWYLPVIFQSLDTVKCVLTQGSMTALIVAVIAIFIRSCFRVAELRGGFGGHLANNEVTYMILESTMVAIAALALTVIHPGVVFGQFWKLKLARAVFSSPPAEMVTVSDTKASH